MRQIDFSDITQCLNDKNGIRSTPCPMSFVPQQLEGNTSNFIEHIGIVKVKKC